MRYRYRQSVYPRLYLHLRHEIGNPARVNIVVGGTAERGAGMLNNDDRARARARDNARVSKTGTGIRNSSKFDRRQTFDSHAALDNSSVRNSV